MSKSHVKGFANTLVLVICCSCLLSTLAEEPVLEIVNGRKVLPGNLIVRVDKARITEVRDALSVRGFELIKAFARVDVEWWRFDSRTTVPEALDVARRIPGVPRAYPVAVYELFSAPGRNDAYYQKQYALRLMDFPQAWKLLGAFDPIVVALADTGMNVGLTTGTDPHLDLKDNIYTNPGEILDNEDNDENGYTDDLHGWDCYGGDNG